MQYSGKKDVGFRMSDFGWFRAQLGKTGGCPQNHPKSDIRHPKSFFRVVPCSAWQNWRLSSKSPEIRHPTSEILLQSMLFPKAERMRCIASLAVRFPSSSAGFTSTMSSEVIH